MASLRAALRQVHKVEALSISTFRHLCGERRIDLSFLPFDFSRSIR
jgi:hypothetical protein